MAEKEDEHEIIPGEVTELGDSISVISGEVVGAYTSLSGTFDVNQRSMAEELNLEQNVKSLVELTKTQIEDAKKEAKTHRDRFYISTAITVIAVIIAIIAFFA